MFKRQTDIFESGKIRYIPIADILPNPNQPRKIFEENSLRELSLSIRRHGVLQPLTVRRRDLGFELVAGERRLRAAKLAGRAEVPCIILGVDGEQSSLLALIENLQRRDLDFIEEAEGIARLISAYGLSQEEAANGIGKSQSAVANKLRILKHPPEVLELLRENGFTERHARALLRLESDSQRLTAAKLTVEQGMNVAMTEAYVEKLLTAKAPAGRQTLIVKDVRIFLNTVRHAMMMMRRAGLNADMDEADEPNSLVLTIRIPKKAKAG